MMMGRINDPFPAQYNTNTLRFHNFNGPLEALIDPLGNLMCQRIFYMHLRAKLMIHLNWLYYYMGLSNKVGLTVIVF